MTDWKGLCAELLNGIELDVAREGIENPDRFQALIDRIRAALAQPEPEATDEELETTARAAEIHYMEDHGGLAASTLDGVHAQLQAQRLAGLRAVATRYAADEDMTIDGVVLKSGTRILFKDVLNESLAVDRGREILKQHLVRWGRPAIAPISASEFLEPEWMRQEDQTRKTTDHAQLIDGEWWAPRSDLFSMQRILENARAHAARRAIEPEERWYPSFADWLEREMPEGTVIGDPLWWASKIATYLQSHAHPAIKPVPVSERLPGPEDRDAGGRCWWAANVGIYDHWRKLDLDKALNTPWRPTYWLPHWALPVPTSQP